MELASKDRIVSIEEENVHHGLDRNMNGRRLKLVATDCCLCGNEDSDQIAVGEDFEYRTSEDEFKVSHCRQCGLVYLNPRPDLSEFERIYPAEYHAFEFSEKEFGFVYKIRRRLEAKRVLSWCKDLPDDARILDVGCGDGFHLGLFREYGKKTWTLEGVDLDERAVDIGRKQGLRIHHGSLDTVELARNSFDLVILIQTIEHVANPVELLGQINSLVRPGGSLVIVTDNTESMDFSLFKRRHWGGYHFPRHWNLFNRTTIKEIAKITHFEAARITTQVSPVNWTYSIRNYLVDRQAPMWLVNRFSLRSPVSLSFFTVFDMFHQLLGRGALLNAVFRRSGDASDSKLQ